MNATYGSVLIDRKSRKQQHPQSRVQRVWFLFEKTRMAISRMPFNVMIEIEWPVLVGALSLPCICLASAFFTRGPASHSLWGEKKRHLSVLGSSLMCTSLAVSRNKWDSSEKPSKTNKSNKVLSLTLCVLWWHPLLPFSPFVFLPPSRSPKSAFFLYTPRHSPVKHGNCLPFFFGRKGVARFNKQMYPPLPPPPPRGNLKERLLCIFSCLGKVLMPAQRKAPKEWQRSRIRSARHHTPETTAHPSSAFPDTSAVPRFLRWGLAGGGLLAGC